MRALALLCLLSAPLPAQSWHSGDAHIHVQQCDTPINLTMDEVKSAMDAADLDVAAVQLWGSPWTPTSFYLSAYAPLITGLPDPSCDATHTLQIGLEVSGFPASQFGHLQVLGATSGFFPTDALYPGPIEAFYDSALLGYAHVSWFADYDTVPFLGHTNGAYMAPIDAALGTIDYIETTRVIPDPGLEAIPWWGLYYKLQNAGIRISLVAGSDNSCFVPEIGDGQTHALVNGPLTFAAWCTAIRKGRTSISRPGEYIESWINGLPTGSQVNLTAPTNVQVSATAPCEVIMDGQVVATMPFGGIVSVPVTESCWIATRYPGAHTAASYVIVGDEPVTSALDAQYWVDYCDSFAANIGVYEVPTAEAEILTRIAAARQVFSALLARALAWPAGVSEYGPSTQACEGPISIGVTSSFAVDCVNAPPNANGFLVIGTAPISLVNSGITVLVSPFSPYVLIPVVSTSGGYCKVPVAVNSGKQFYAQFVWTGGCPGALAASDGMSVVMP